MLRAYAALVALGLIWGLNFIYMKWATALISPMQTVFIHVLFGFLPLALMAWRAKVVTREQLRHLLHVAVMSVHKKNASDPQLPMLIIWLKSVLKAPDTHIKT